jgi:hypothetical protein
MAAPPGFGFPGTTTASGLILSHSIVLVKLEEKSTVSSLRVPQIGTMGGLTTIAIKGIIDPCNFALDPGN